MLLQKTKQWLQNRRWRWRHKVPKSYTSWAVILRLSLPVQELLAKGTIDARTVMVLVNAIYFKGWWKEPFFPNKTEQQ